MRVGIIHSFVLICMAPVLCSCANSEGDLRRRSNGESFTGNWQGSGVDAAGNVFTFVATVIDVGDDKYRMLILDDFDTPNEPMHVMDGVLKDNQYRYTADGGMYVGGGELDKDTFEGYYKGPVDGTFTMQRVK